MTDAQTQEYDKIAMLARVLGNIQASTDTIIELFAKVHGIDADEFTQTFNRYAIDNTKIILDCMLVGKDMDEVEKRLGKNRKRLN
jgi:hypothetical protein